MNTRQKETRNQKLFESILTILTYNNHNQFSSNFFSLQPYDSELSWRIIVERIKLNIEFVWNFTKIHWSKTKVKKWVIFGFYIDTSWKIIAHNL